MYIQLVQRKCLQCFLDIMTGFRFNVKAKYLRENACTKKSIKPLL
jgi:hypothetical protein